MKNELILTAILLTIIPMTAFADAPYWNDYDGDGQLSESDVDAMCDEDYVDEEYKDKQNCKKLYNWIEDTYGYETEESESDYRENYDYIKDICEGFKNSNWDGGECVFKYEDDEEEFDHYLADEGLYDAYQQSLQD